MTEVHWKSESKGGVGRRDEERPLNQRGEGETEEEASRKRGEEEENILGVLN